MDVGVKLFKAIRANRIDVPVVHYDELENGGIRLYLYGGRIVEWTPEKESSRKAAKSAKEIAAVRRPGSKRAAKQPSGEAAKAKPEQQARDTKAEK